MLPEPLNLFTEQNETLALPNVTVVDSKDGHINSFSVSDIDTSKLTL